MINSFARIAASSLNNVAGAAYGSMNLAQGKERSDATLRLRSLKTTPRPSMGARFDSRKTYDRNLLTAQTRVLAMLVLRCRQKLLRKKPGPSSEHEDSLVSRLGGWHANLICLAHSPIVLCVNDKSFLAILIPGRDFPTLVTVCVDRQISPDQDGRSRESYCRRSNCDGACPKTSINSKSVLASMTNLTLDLKRQVGDPLTLAGLMTWKICCLKRRWASSNSSSPSRQSATVFGFERQQRGKFL